MRFILPIVCLAIATPALAQSPTPTPPPSAPATTVAAPTISLLPIPVPANTKVQLEVDAQNEDMLGIVKDFLAGVTAQNIVDSLASASEEEDKSDNADAASTSLTSKASKHKAKKHKTAATTLSPELAKLSLADVLHNIDHVHLLVLDVPAPSPTPSKTAHPKPAVIVPSGLAPLAAGEIAATPGVPAVNGKTLANYYETSFHDEGGHRIVWFDYEDVKMLMVGFHEKRGSAMVLQTPGTTIILRSDGYLDFKPLNALFSAAIHEATKSIPL